MLKQVDSEKLLPLNKLKDYNDENNLDYGEGASTSKVTLTSADQFIR